MFARITFPRLVAFATAAFLAAAATSAPAQQRQLPSQLADSTYWRIVTEFSEPEGPFNRFMVSNETFYPYLVSTVVSRNLTGGAYIGVAPEQNYHYIAAIRPQIAFILDIRREAVVQHLMFKAVFELSATRADFISLLFSKPRPAGVSDTLNAFATWTAFWHIPTDTTLYTPNFTRIYDQLRKKRNFGLSASDSSLLNFLYYSFYYAGPNLMSNGSASPTDQTAGTFGNITSTDRSFLQTEAAYQAVRQLHLRNMVIPIVGDMTGTKALRAIGSFLTEHNTTLTAYYASNVETYLNRAGTTGQFYANVATIPMTPNSVLIRGISPGSICNLQAVVRSGWGAC